MPTLPHPSVGGVTREVGEEAASIPWTQEWRSQDSKQSQTDLKLQAILGVLL